MNVEQQSASEAHAHLIAMFGIGALVLFGVIMLFLGWLKYKDRNNPPKTKIHKSIKTRRKRK